MEDVIELKNIPITSIEEGDRARKEYGDLTQLIDSIKREGLIHPIAVLSIGESQYKLLAGGRRYRACLLGGVFEIPVRVYKNINPDIEKSIELYENLCRKQLDYVEELNLKKQIHELHVKMHGAAKAGPGVKGWTQQDTAKLLGEKQPNINKDLKLAAALEILPDLRKCTNKAEATRVLQKIEKQADSLIKVEEIKREIEARPVNALHQELCDAYQIGDTFDLIKNIPDNSIDFIDLDPDYGVDYGPVIDGKKQETSKEEVFFGNYQSWTPEEYVEKLDKVLAECRRVLKPNGWLILWHSYLTAFETMSTLKKHLMPSPYPAIWLKNRVYNSCPNFRLTNRTEYFFYATKETAVLEKPGRLATFEYSRVKQRDKSHPTEKPIQMMMDIIATFCPVGGRILIPFMGSGNTALAAYNIQRTAKGFDLSTEYKPHYEICVLTGKPGEYMSEMHGEGV